MLKVKGKEKFEMCKTLMGFIGGFSSFLSFNIVYYLITVERTVFKDCPIFNNTKQGFPFLIKA